MVELKNVDVKYKDGGVDALNEVNIRINDGDFVFIVGDSGAGKSTLLKLLTREIAPTDGRVFVNGFNLENLSGRRIPKFRRGIGMIFQDFRLIPTLTVYENVAFVLRATDKSSRFIRQRVPYVLNLVHLADKAKFFPAQLSGGERQRVGIARAFATAPKLIIADEPTGNIDPKLSYDIADLLFEINESGTTVIFVTHDHDMVEYYGGRLISLAAGRVAFDDVITGTSGAHRGR